VISAAKLCDKKKLAVTTNPIRSQKVTRINFIFMMML
jgi:hypothetical protein